MKFAVTVAVCIHTSFAYAEEPPINIDAKVLKEINKTFTRQLGIHRELVMRAREDRLEAEAIRYFYGKEKPTNEEIIRRSTTAIKKLESGEWAGPAPLLVEGISWPISSLGVLGSLHKKGQVVGKVGNDTAVRFWEQKYRSNDDGNDPFVDVLGNVYLMRGFDLTKAKLNKDFSTPYPFGVITGASRFNDRRVWVIEPLTRKTRQQLERRVAGKQSEGQSPKRKKSKAKPQ